MASRRDILAGMTGIAATHLTAVAADKAPGPDLNDPGSNLRAYIKLRGSLDSKPVYDIVRGSVYGLVAGQTARPLFKTVGAQRTVYSRRSALEYSAVSRYVGLLLDWQTEQPLKHWTNPYNGLVCDPPVTHYGPMEIRFLGDRMVPAAMAPEQLPVGTRPWFIMGDVVHMQENVISSAPEMPLFPKADLMTFSGDWHQLADPGLTRIPARLSFTAVETWREWMGMDPAAQQNGTLWWHVAGVKLDGPGDYPPQLRVQLQNADPAFFNPGSG